MLGCCKDRDRNKDRVLHKRSSRKASDQDSAVAEKAEQAFEIPHELAGTLSDTREAQGVFCICVKRKEAELETIDPKGTYIALDNMQDPSNLGAVLRTAEAFGMSGVIVGGGCDIYNAQRFAPMGFFDANFCFDNRKFAFFDFCRQKGYAYLSFHAVRRGKEDNRYEFFWLRYLRCRQRGSGISPDVINPLRTSARGLFLDAARRASNAAAAAAVLMWELTK